MKNVLVTGGAGYIGSHTCIELLNAGFDIVVADNYYNASPVVLDRVKQITGKDFRFYNADMTKHEDVEKIFSECPDITAVIQFAAYKAVGESVSKPIEYYYNNLNCTLVILDVMRHHDCHNFVFSSSATVYGDPASVPITEDFPVGATTNPYGTTKAFTERILQDVCKADPSLNVALLRYFNPIGAHKSGLIGEDPNGIPNNLMPYIAKVAVGKLEKVHVFGNDYPTPDGTGVRDYIHVVDLARGHVCAIRKLEKYKGCIIADSVGLGKTYEALAVMKYYQERNDRILVLCPKRLRDNWTLWTQDNDDRNPLADDRFSYTVLNHTDLSRYHGMSGEVDLEHLRWGHFDLLVIDESHNFRNGGEVSGEDAKENRYLKLLNKVVRAGVKTKVLMLSATPVNNKFIDLKNQLALAYEGDASQMSKKLDTTKSIDEIFRQAQKAFNAWSKLPAEERTTDELLRTLDFDFFELLDSVTIARSRKHIEKYYRW